MYQKRFLPLAAGILLASCGGGGGSVNSTPPPPPGPGPTPPPSPTPSPSPSANISNPQQSQSFVNDAVSSSITFDLTTKTTIAGSAEDSRISIRYDAGTKSYSVSHGGTQETFAAGDLRSSDQGISEYQRGSSYLTLVTTPYTGNTSNKYVGLGFLQRNVVANNRQQTEFGVFTYGFDTPSTGMPRTGTAGYTIDVFGLSAFPGAEPSVYQGSGTFNADFISGVFSAHSWLTETELVSGEGITGGGIEFIGAGHLSSSNGTFSGNAQVGGRNGWLAGSLDGRFYGPSAQEIGAAFSGSNSDGASFAGGFTGQFKPGAQAPNLALTNMQGNEHFYPLNALLTTTSFEGSPDTDSRTYQMGGGLEWQNQETFTYGPGLSSLPAGQFTINDKVPSSDPNFTAYRKSFNGQEVYLELYKPGSGNTQLALTYASLGRWTSTAVNGAMREKSQVFFTYGIETPSGLLAGRTGTGRYDGVVYGAGANDSTGGTWDITGTSRFVVDFSNQSYSGGLTLVGTGTNGTASMALGDYDFSGRLSPYSNETQVGLNLAGTPVGDMTTGFFGPDGEEIGGTFTLRTPPGGPAPGTSISGATVARRQ